PKVAAPMMFDPMLGSVGGYSDTASVLEPFAGYMIENTGAEAETIHVPPVEASAAASITLRRQGAEIGTARAEWGEGRSPGGGPSGRAWTLRLIARSASEIDESNLLGVDPTATEGFDRLDAGKPPPAPGHAMEIAFVHRDWPGRSSRYRRDVRGLGE